MNTKKLSNSTKRNVHLVKILLLLGIGILFKCGLEKKCLDLFIYIYLSLFIYLYLFIYLFIYIYLFILLMSIDGTKYFSCYLCIFIYFIIKLRLFNLNR